MRFHLLLPFILIACGDEAPPLKKSKAKVSSVSKTEKSDKTAKKRIKL